MKKKTKTIKESVIELEPDFFAGETSTVAKRVASLHVDFPGYDTLVIERKPGTFRLYGTKRFKRKKRRKHIDEKD